MELVVIVIIIIIIWRLAANILNKQSRTPTRGGPAVWRWGRLTTPHCKKSCYEMLQRASEMDGFFVVVIIIIIIIIIIILILIIILVTVTQ
jgi:uncharacterized membrane protein